MIKVCHITDTLDIGGLEKVVTDTVLNLKGYECEVWCLRHKGALAKKIEQNGIKVKEFGFAGRMTPFLLYRLAKELGRGKFDIVHSHGLYPPMWAVLAAIIAGIPVRIVHCHSMHYNVPLRDKIRFNLLSHFITKIIAVSKAVKTSVVEAIGIDPDKIIVVYNGTGANNIKDAGPRDGIRKVIGLEDGDFVIGNIGRLVECKGQEFLIKALADVKTVYSRCRCVIIGDGRMREKLEREIKRLDLTDTVILLGESADAEGLLPAMDLLVNTSVADEGLGLVLVEGSSAGLPLIATDIGGQPEVVKNSVNGFIVKSKDPAVLAEKIKYLIKNPETRKRMGENSLAIWREKFTLDEMIRRIKILYETAMRHGGIWKKDDIDLFVTRPDPNNVQFIEAMATYHFVRDMVKGMVVLDAGCGYGYGTGYLSDLAREVVGVDRRAKALDFAARTYPGNNVRYVRSDLTEMDLPDGYFDVVCLFEVIHQVEDQGTLLKECSRVLKDGGLLLVSTRRKAKGMTCPGPSHIRTLTVEELKGLVSESGFEGLELYDMNRPEEAYELEKKLGDLRRFDPLCLRRFVPRVLLSSIVRFILKNRGVRPPEEIKYEDFVISKDTFETSPGFLVIYRKIPRAASVIDTEGSLREKVSCVIGTKNAEDDIGQCIESVRWADEIIIVDDFSTDRTIEIARKYTDRIFQHKLEGWDAQRAFGTKSASFDWVLWMDADERVTPALEREIKEKLRDSHDKSGFLFGRMNIFLGREVKYCGWSAAANPRLLNRKRSRFDLNLKYQEVVELDGDAGVMENVLIHYTCRSLKDYLKRMDLWAALNAEDLIYKKVRITLFNGIFYFLFKPPAVFIYKYFFKSGYRDGYIGFLICVLSAFTYFISYAKVWKAQHEPTSGHACRKPGGGRWMKKLPDEVCEKLINFYRTADKYGERIDSHDDGAYREYVSFVGRFAANTDRILDLGCGTGLSTLMLGRIAKEVTGADVSPIFIQKAEVKPRAANVSFRCVDILNLDLPDESYDIVSAFLTIEHIYDVPAALSEMARVVKTGGLVIILSPNLLSPFNELYKLADAICAKKSPSRREEKFSFMKSIWRAVRNTAILFTKKLFHREDFRYRLPVLENRFDLVPDNDAVYLANPLDLKFWFERNGFKIIKYQAETPWGRVFPSFVTGIHIVARKEFKKNGGERR